MARPDQIHHDQTGQRFGQRLGKEPCKGSHHLWINAKRIPEDTLVPMIANAFVDWTCNGGDLVVDKTTTPKNS